MVCLSVTHLRLPMVVEQSGAGFGITELGFRRVWSLIRPGPQELASPHRKAAVAHRFSVNSELGDSESPVAESFRRPPSFGLRGLTLSRRSSSTSRFSSEPVPQHVPETALPLRHRPTAPPPDPSAQSVRPRPIRPTVRPSACPPVQPPAAGAPLHARPPADCRREPSRSTCGTATRAPRCPSSRLRATPRPRRAWLLETLCRCSRRASEAHAAGAAIRGGRAWQRKRYRHCLGHPDVPYSSAFA